MPVSALTEEHLEKAMHVLDQMSFVLIAEKLDNKNVKQSMHKYLGFDNLTTHANTQNVPPLLRECLTPWLMRRNALDIALYEYAVAKFG